MHAGIPRRARFVIAAVVVGTGLYALFWWYQRLPFAVGYGIPVVAVVVAAQGASWKRRVAALTCVLVGTIVVGALLQATGIVALAANGDSFGSSWGPFAANVLGEVLAFTVPIVTLILFVGRRPSMLWTARARPTTSPKLRVRHRSPFW